jgi:Xaa-Pro aminopeptidase
MQTMHPTLLIGPADWNPRQLPREEFDDRVAALWRDHERAGGAIVYGDSSNHAALAYLTHFTPKLEAGLALIPRRGEPRMLIGGGANMLPAARALTFVEDLAPLRDAAMTVAAWSGALPAGGSLLLIGGEAMPYGMRRALDQALGPDIAIEVGDATLQARMTVKRPHEMRAIREACGVLDATVAALRDAARDGKGVTDCILSAEHAALRRGAQDVRSLFSLDGGRTMQPFTVPSAQRRDPLQVYLAVRHAGYWADGFVRLPAPGDPLQGQVDGILAAMVARAKPGLSCRDLQQIVDGVRGPVRHHPLADGVFGSSIGLSLDEPPLLRRGCDATLESGAVYSLRAGLVDDAGTGAVVSAIVALTAHGTEVMWPVGGLS